ncbi:hypothetical protein DdX_21660 [Ditylenchus destructor]|uniref:F-box domain-containing protein n=1 Tax=Ditylenchus destructor TaxID=166010 RepID=A0AAD4MEL0_9BILA|nr:hypothetical protein DdX_21660 [Ditylenchus destructor]
MSDYNHRKRPAPAAISYDLKVAKSKTNSKPIPVLCYDIVRDVFANFDRKTLCRMQIVNKRFNFVIEKEFNNSAPYLILPELQYAYYQWTMDVGKVLYVDVDLTVFQKIVASKFIRFRLLNVIYDMGFNPMKLLTVRHAWENGDLRVNWTCVPNFRPTEELNRSFANCNKLFVNGCDAVSILHEMDVGKYRNLTIYDYDYDPISQEIPWTKITDFLFHAGENDKPCNYMYIETDRPPNRENRMEFINSVKKRFEAADIALDFEFHWNAKFEKETFPVFEKYALGPQKR